MAQRTARGFLLSDAEAAALRRWVKRQPSAGPNINAGFESVAGRIGRSRPYLSYALTATTAKRQPINADDLAALCRMLSDDARALVDKLREIHDSADYRAVWTLYAAHGGRYAGPKYDAELAALEDALRVAGHR